MVSLTMMSFPVSLASVAAIAVLLSPSLAHNHNASGGVRWNNATCPEPNSIMDYACYPDKTSEESCMIYPSLILYPLSALSAT